MKDPIPIFDDDYFKRKKEEKHRAAIKRAHEREKRYTEQLQKLYDEPRHRASRNIDMAIHKVRYEEEDIASKIERTARYYINTPEKTAEEFIERVDQLLEGQPYTSCPITTFTDTPTSTNTKRLPQKTVGEAFQDKVLLLYLFGATFAIITLVMIANIW